MYPSPNQPVSHPGASNAEDFQPQTANPQTAPGQVFPGRSSFQSQGGNEDLLNLNSEIQVPSNPASGSEVTVAKNSWGDVLLIILLAAAVIVFGLWLMRRRRTDANQPVAATKVDEASVAETPAEPAAKKPAKAKPKAVSTKAKSSTKSAAAETVATAVKPKPKTKPKPKKSKSQRKKRAKRG